MKQPERERGWHGATHGGLGQNQFHAPPFLSVEKGPASFSEDGLTKLLRACRTGESQLEGSCLLACVKESL